MPCIRIQAENSILFKVQRMVILVLLVLLFLFLSLNICDSLRIVLCTKYKATAYESPCFYGGKAVDSREESVAGEVLQEW